MMTLQRLIEQDARVEFCAQLCEATDILFRNDILCRIGWEGVTLAEHVRHLERIIFNRADMAGWRQLLEGDFIALYRPMAERFPEFLTSLQHLAEELVEKHTRAFYNSVKQHAE